MWRQQKAPLKYSGKLSDLLGKIVCWGDKGAACKYAKSNPERKKARALPVGFRRSSPAAKGNLRLSRPGPLLLRGQHPVTESRHKASVALKVVPNPRLLFARKVVTAK